MSNYNILAFSEHWLNESEAELIKIGRFSPRAKFCRKTYKNGGVMILSDDTFDTKEINFVNISTEKDCEVTGVYLTSIKTIFICLYRAPIGDFDKFLLLLENLLSTALSYGKVIIGGDFNINFYNENKKCNQILDIFTSYGFKKFVNFATHDKSCIDNVFSNCNLCNLVVEDACINVSDHVGIMLEFTVESNQKNTGIIKNVRPITDVGKFMFYSAVENSDWSFIDTNSLTNNQKMDMFLNILTVSHNYAFPLKTIKVNQNTKSNLGSSWYNDHLKAMKSNLDFMTDVCRRDKNPLVKQSRNLYKVKYKNALKKAKIEFNTSFVNNNPNKSKAMWQVINNNMATNKKADKLDVSADSLNVFFTSIADDIVCSIPPSSTDPLSLMSFQNMNEYFKFKRVSVVEVRDAINSLKPSGSKDIYSIDVRLLKSVKETIIIPLTKLINSCIDELIFPDGLKIAKCIPVFKKGDKTDLKNYRPISLLPIISKVYEKLIKKQILEFLNVNNILSNRQFGFRQKKSTGKAILEFIEYLLDRFDKGDFTIAKFIDLSRAFDCVDHKLLIRKLYCYNFHPMAIKLIMSYLSNRKQYVYVNGEFSEPKDVTIGVPQGSVLGPLLFLLFINDFPDSIDCFKVLFADDTTISESSNSLTDAINKAREAFKVASQWFIANRLSLNESKTVDMLFTLNSHNYQSNDFSCKFLGIELDSKLQWDPHINNICKKLNKCVYLIRNLSDQVSLEVIKTAYYGLFETHLNYGILAWGNATGSKRVFAIQRRIIRVMRNLSYREDCKQQFIALELLTFPSLYIYNCLLHMKENFEQYNTNCKFHDHNTRGKNDVRPLYNRLTKLKNSTRYDCVRFYNVLPDNFKVLTYNNFKNVIKIFLKEKAYYSTEEYLNDCKFSTA